jgi:GNAT superfamily N-acetyltransferase
LACRVVPSIGDAKPHRKHAVLREATVSDLPGIWRVRYAVQENLLTPGRISDEDVRREIEETGRGWVVVEGGEIRAFGICNGQTGNIWALFVHPNSQGAGYGSMLHDHMLAWLSHRKAPTPWLTTGPNTKARGFYERRGWVLVSAPENGDARFEHSNAA